MITAVYKTVFIDRLIRFIINDSYLWLSVKNNTYILYAYMYVCMYVYIYIYIDILFMFIICIYIYIYIYIYILY